MIPMMYQLELDHFQAIKDPSNQDNCWTQVNIPVTLSFIGYQVDLFQKPSTPSDHWTNQIHHPAIKTHPS